MIQLNTFTKYGYNLRFYVRPQANLLSNYTNNRRWERYDIKECRLDISGKTYFPMTDRNYMKNMINGQKFLGNPQVPTYNIPFSESPDLYQHGVGGFDFSNITTPQLTINTAALPADCYCDILLACHNYVRVCVGEARSGAEIVIPL
jgi:hypothetical protein